jgi:hypothetical protein
MPLEPTKHLNGRNVATRPVWESERPTRRQSYRIQPSIVTKLGLASVARPGSCWS